MMKTRSLIRIRINEDGWKRLSTGDVFASRGLVKDLPDEPLAQYMATFDRMPSRTDILENIDSLQKNGKHSFNIKNCLRIVQEIKEIPVPVQMQKAGQNGTSIFKWKLRFGIHHHETHEISGSISAVQFDVVILGSMMDEARITFDYRKKAIMARAKIEGRDEFKITVPIDEKQLVVNWEKEINNIFVIKEQEKMMYEER